MHQDSIMIQAALKLAQLADSKGVEYEIFLEQGRLECIEYRDRSGIIAHAQSFQGLGLRLIWNSRMGFSFTTHPSKIEDCLDSALSSARISQPDPARLIPQPDMGYPEPPARFDPQIQALTPESSLELLSRMLDSAKLHPQIQIQSGAIEYGLEQVMVINSHGVQIQDRLTSISGWLELGIPPQVSSFESQSSRDLARFNPEWIAQTAAQRAIFQLDSKHPDRLDLDLILMPRALQQLLEYITVPQLCGDQLIAGRSPYAAKLGTQICSELISFRDDGCLEAGIGTMKFDGEGIPTRSKYLIQQGILKNFILDSYSAAKLGTSSTGNAVRDFCSVPQPWITNLILEPGDWSYQELIQESRAILIQDLIGAHTSSMPSGEFCLGAQNSIWINKGQQIPLKHLGISGNLIQLLEGVDAVVKDQLIGVGKYYLNPIRIPIGSGFKLFSY